MKSSDSFEKGKRLYEERKYKEALTSFQEARDLDKENEEIQKWIDKTKAEIPKNEQLKAEYERGVELYSKGEYQKALEAFKEVEKLDPDYQDVKKRISDCEAIIPIAAAFDEAVKSFNTAEQTKEVEDYEKAKSKFQQIQKQMPTYQKDKVDDYISKCDAAISLRLYFQALELYSGGNYKEALEKLEKLQRSYPDYKKSEVENMIKDIRKGLKTPPKVTQPPPQVTSRDEYKDEFDAAVKAFIEKKYEDAKAKFDTLQKKDPNYRKAEVASYIAQCDEEIKRAIYDEAIQLYQNEKYAQAKARFEGLQKQYPDYKKDEVASWIKDCDDGDAKKLYGDAEKLYQEQNYAVAKTKFETLQKEYPDYKKEEVASWIKKCDEALKPKSNILLYVMIGSVGLLIMVGVLAFALTRQKTRYCPICGREMDPTWTQCLFCAQQAPQAGQQPSHAAIKPAIGSTPQIAQQSSGIPTTRLGVGGASVIVKEGERKGQEYRLEGNLINIGRDENANNVALNDSAASRMHAQIKFQGGRFVLSDLGGTNGTYVNGKQINTMQLEDGDEITIGRTVLLFKIGG
jgi:tetratricopeptide (TPR) repeat protein